MPTVRDILHQQELYSVNQNQTVAEAARRMAELHVGAILVLEGSALKGIFSERDLMTRVVVERRNPADTLVAEVMTCNVATVEDSATPEEAMESMRIRNCRHLPVLRGPQVVGFLSMRDLMNFELERKTEELQHMRAYIHGSA